MDEKGNIIAGRTEPSQGKPNGDIIYDGNDYVVKFALYNSNGVEVKRFESGENVDVTTDYLGKLNYKGLRAGTYTLKEIKQPKGYILSDKEWKITIDNDGEIRYEDVKHEEIKRMKMNRSMKANLGMYDDHIFTNLLRGSADMNLISLYPENNNKPSEYIRDDKGEYAKDGEENSKRVINTSKNKKDVINSPEIDDTFYYYNGIWSGKETMSAGVNKYAEPTAVDGKFDINLQVIGNTVELDERTDVIIVYDASRSMWQYNRVEPAYNATKSFVERILSPEINKSGKIRVGLVTYGSDLFDGRNTNLKFYNYNGNFTDFNNVKTTDNCYKGLTSNAYDITSKLFTKSDANSLYDPNISKNYAKSVWLGGTFTTKAFQEAQNILDNSDAAHKIVIHVADGMPTKSLRVKKVEDKNGRKLATEFYNHNSGYSLSDKAYGYYQKGDGTSFYFKDISPKNDDNHLHSKYEVDGYKIETHGFVTESYAEHMKEKGTKIISLGISIGEDDFKSYVDKPNVISGEDAKKLLENTSSGKDCYYDTSNTNLLTENFSKIMTNIIQDTIQNGRIEDPMGEMVNLEFGEDGVFDYNDYTLYASDGSSMVRGVVYDKDGKVVIGGTLLNNLKVGLEGDKKGKIIVNGLNLGKKQWVRIKYSVNLDTENKNFKGMKFFHTNRETLLFPNRNYPNTKWNFPIPSVKGPKDTIIKITNEPNRIEFIKKDSDGKYLEGTEFVLYKSDNSIVKNSERIAGSDGVIRYEKLPPGSYILKETMAIHSYKLPPNGILAEFTVDVNGKISIDGDSKNQNVKFAKKDLINEHDYKTMEFYVMKIDHLTKSQIMNGALGLKLQSIKPDENGEKKVIATVEENLATIDKGGIKIEIPTDIQSGEYELIETVAPINYIRSDTRYIISIDQSRRTISYLKRVDVNGNITTINQLIFKEKIQFGAEDEIEVSPIKIEIDNIKRTEYPHTGGRGSIIFYILGFSLMVESLYIMHKKKHYEI